MVENEDGDEEDEQRYGADDEGIALHDAALGKAEGEEQHEGDGAKHRAGPHRGLAFRERAEHPVAHAPGPAGIADGEALKRQEGDAGRSKPGQRGAAAHWVRHAAGRTGQKKERERAGKPQPAMRENLHEARRGLRGKRKTGQPT
jgi:hypothetical protein